MTTLVKIGNSQGVKIPKNIIDLLQLKGKLTLELRDGGLLIRPANYDPQAGWAEAFAKAKKEAEEKAKTDPKWRKIVEAEAMLPDDWVWEEE